MNISSISAGAISQALERVGAVAAAIAGAADPSNPTDMIDFSEAAVELSAAKLAATASVQVFRAEQEIVRNTLDMFA
jgi:hypothetical protein